VLLFIGLAASATHMSGGEIYWECIGPNQYRISLVVYRDCAGINVDPSYNLQLTSPCGNRNLTVTTTGGTELSQLCDIELPNSTCNGGTLPGIQQYIYTGVITLPSCNSWSIRWTNIYRNNAIVNLTNPGTREMFIEAVLNNAAEPCNDSPVFTNVAIPYVCLGYPVTYSYGAFDPEADSVSYQLIGARMAGGNPIPYVVPNTPTLPIPGLTLDPVTGEINFTLNTAGNWVVVVRVNQYNAQGQLIGTIMRDMQFVAYPCSNIPPDAATGLIDNLTGSATQVGPRAVQVCESGDFCFDMEITDVNATNVLTAFSNIQQNLPGATFSYTGTNPITAHVCWNATNSTAGFYAFIVNVNDGACPIPAFQTYVYSVQVLPGVYADLQVQNESCLGAGDGSITAVVTAGTDPYTYNWNTGNTEATVYGDPGDYEVVIEDGNGCVSHVLTGTIGVDALPNEANAGMDVTLCAEEIPVQLQGTLVNATEAQWSGGSGQFTGTGLNVQYQPTLAEIQSGSVVLTLTTTDNTSCPPASDDVLITFLNSFQDVVVTANDATCYNTNDGSASVTPEQNWFSYQWNDPAAQTTATATNLSPGNYEVTITSDEGCEIILPVTIGPSVPLVITQIDVTNETCLGAGDGSATASVVGGTEPYSYEWSNGGSEATIYASSGTYSVMVIDAMGCATTVSQATIGADALPNEANAGADAVMCGTSIQLNGSVINATGGAWSGGSGTFNGSGLTTNYTPSPAEIAAGSANLTLTTIGNDACPAAADDVVVQIPNSFANGTITTADASCFDVLNGTASFSPADPSFTFLWNDPAAQATSTATGLGTGTYEVVVTDAFGCTITLPATIGPAAPIAITNVVVTDETCVGAGDGTATVSISGGTQPYIINWSNGGNTASITATSGTYTVSVTDANNCTAATADAIIGSQAQPNIANAGADQIVCADALPIQLSASVTNATSGAWSGGNGTFGGTWDNGSYMPDATEIAAGSVTLTLTTIGNSNCPDATDDVTIALPNNFASATVTTTDASCFDLSNGSASFTPADPAFTYLWSDPASQATANATGLAAGSYTVTATDQFGCTITLPAIIGPSEPMTIASIDVVDETCLGNGNGTATVNVTGGNAPYIINWSNGSNSNTITATSGTYTVTITDQNNCAPVTADAIIGAQALPNNVDAGADQIVCVDAFPVQLSATVANADSGSWSGGSELFTGTWSQAEYMPSSADVSAGSVTLSLTSIGNTNCPQVSDEVIIVFPNSFVNGSVSTTDASCFELSNGTATFSPADPTFTFLWNDPAAQTTSTATGLAPGIHNVTVTDQFGCSEVFTAFIGPASALSIANLTSTNESCLGAGDGIAMVSVTGGTAPYNYSWSNGGNTNSITATSGTYTVSITDANGCAPITGDITIIPSGIPNVADAGADQLACMNSYPIPLNGNFQNATSGSWSGGNGAINNNGPNAEYWPTIAEITAGTVDLIFTTSGNNTCPPDSDTLQITLSNSYLNATLTSSSTTCNGAGDGSLTFSPADPGFSYVWSAAGSNGPVISGLPAGDYTLTVTDQYGCDTTFTGTITDIPQLAITNINVTDVTCFDGTDGSAQITVGGGTAPYSIEWSNGITGDLVNAVPAGNYSANIVDANGCTATTDVAIGQPDPIVLTAMIADTVCVNSPVQMIAQATGGHGGYTFTWVGIGTGDTLMHEFTEGQFVVLSVEDSLGCTTQPVLEPVNVIDLTTAELNVFGDTIVCPGQMVTVGASVDDYDGYYTINWPELQQLGDGPFTFPLWNSQVLQVIVSNTCGQTVIDSIYLAVDAPPAFNLPAILAQGCAPLTVQLPAIPFSGVNWIWDLGNGQTSTAAAPSVTYGPGTHTVTLTLSTQNGCTSSASTTSSQIIGYSSPVAAFSASTWSTDLTNANIQFTDLSSGNITSYSWIFGDGGTSGQQNPQHQYDDFGTFQVELTVQNEQGCTSTVANLIEITLDHDITIPNAFTPNPGGGGGVYDPLSMNNDVFYAFVKNVEDFRMRIFNRWGELVFESTDVHYGWDGFYRGELSQQDVYVVQMWARFVDGREFMKLSDLTLIR
jgi:PKD repeat protein